MILVDFSATESSIPAWTAVSPTWLQRLWVISGASPASFCVIPNARVLLPRYHSTEMVKNGA